MSVDERLTEDEIQTLKKLAQEAQKDGVNRRELMQAAGMTGLGALLGGGSTAALVGSASASASTSDSDGNVGLPSNRVDVFADGVDSKSLDTDKAEVTGTSKITINVPSDESTLSDAVQKASEHKTNAAADIEINIESGHTVSSKVDVTGVDLSNATITSVDATVPVSISAGSFLRFAYCQTPTIDCKFDQQGAGDDGLVVRNGRAEITDGSGVINAGRWGLYARKSSNVECNNADFSGSGTPLYVTERSSVSAQGFVGTGGGDRGLWVSRGSMVHAQDGEFDGSSEGIQIRRSFVNLQNVTVDGGGSAMLVSDSSSLGGSIVFAPDMTIKNISGTALACRNDSKVSLKGSDISVSSSGDMVVASSGGDVGLTSANIDATNATGNAIKMGTDGGSLCANSVSVSNTSDIAVVCSASTANLTKASFSSLSNNAVEVYRGGQARLQSATVDGSAIAAGDTNLASFNTIDDQGGVEYGIVWA